MMLDHLCHPLLHGCKHLLPVPLTTLPIVIVIIVIVSIVIVIIVVVIIVIVTKMITAMIWIMMIEKRPKSIKA